MIVVATAAFDGTQDTVVVTWSTAFVNTPTIASAGIVITDGFGAPSVDIISVTNTGCTVETSGRFTGAVELIASGT